MTNNEFLLNRLPKQNLSEIHAVNHKIATVMYSGGVDSTVALWWAIDHYEKVKVIIVNYNQPHAIEVKKAIQIAEMVGADYNVIKIGFPKEFWGIENHLTRGQACLMTSLAAIDISHDGTDIVMGILKTDYYGDCNRGFLDKLAGVLFHYQDWGKIGIATPLRSMESKTDVIALGYQLGAPLLSSWSCRDPQNNKPCGKCFQCKERENAFRELSIKYSINHSVFEDWQSQYGSPYHPKIDFSDEQLTIIAKAFLSSGGFKRGMPCWKYLAPDGTYRISTHMKNVKKASNVGKIIRTISAHGYLDDMYRWEFCVLDDGTYAVTDRIPDYEIIINEINKNAEL